MWIVVLQTIVFCINPIQDGLFWGLLTDTGRRKKDPLPKICHTYPTMMKLGTFITYQKKIQKIYESRDTPLGLSWHQHLFIGNQNILLYPGIQIQIVFRYMISIHFNFSWVLLDCYKNMIKILMMSCKNGCPSPSWNKGIFKSRLLRHIFCLLRHQQNFVRWINLYYGCGHVTKVW